MMKDFPEPLCWHEDELNLLLEEMVRAASWEIARDICEGITGPMRGNNGNPTELADYYLSNIHEGWEKMR